MSEYDKEYFRKHFEGLPPKAMAVIALRAAMRVLPVLAQRGSWDDGPFAYWNEGEPAQHALALFRCFEVSLFVNTLTKTDPATDAAARATPDAATDAYAAAAYDAADGATDAADATRAISGDIQFLKENRPNWFARRLGKNEAAILVQEPLWREPLPVKFQALWTQLQSDLLGLGAGFETWIEWYEDRLAGTPIDWDLEYQCALLSKEQLSRSPAEINEHLRLLRGGAQTKQLRRVRAIFLRPWRGGQDLAHQRAARRDEVEGRTARPRASPSRMRSIETPAS